MVVPGKRPGTGLLAPLGLFGGFIDASGGGGWGPVTTPTLIASGTLDPRKVIGSVSASEFAITVSASLGFLIGLGGEALDWRVIGGLLVGGVVAAPFAAYLVKHLSLPVLGAFVGSIVLITNSRTIMVSTGTENAWVYGLLAAGALALVATALVKVRRARAAGRPEETPGVTPASLAEESSTV